MKFLYPIFIKFYAFLVCIFSLWNPKAKKWIKGRKNWGSELKEGVEGLENIQWFHCASLGEFEQAKPLIEKIKANSKSTSILITFFSPSGYEIKKDYELADYICYLPLDTKKNASNFLSIVTVEKAYFVKYEVWPNLFQEIKKRNIPFYIISATFRENQIYFKKAGKWLLSILQLPTHIFVQNEESKAVLFKYGIESMVSGDTRFDRVMENSKDTKSISIIEEFTRSKFTLIVGSSWEKEEAFVSELLNKNGKEIKIVLAPHDIGESHVSSAIKLFKKEVAILRYSQIEASTDLSQIDVIVIDNIGMLSNLYQYGSVAFIGGGFTNALHNILEPATFGIPVLYGNNNLKFQEAKEMKNFGGGIEIQSYEEFEKALFELIKSPLFLDEESNKNKVFIETRTGATDFIYNSTC